MTKNKTAKPTGTSKPRLFFKLVKQNLVSLHHFIWGKGWRRFVLAIVLTLLLLVAVLTVAVEVTSTPKFCNTCHNMKPYYASWKSSSHKHVTCTDCHFPPGLKNKLKGKFTALSMLVNYFTGVYKRNKPWAEISDESCMRSGCHETRTLSGKVNYKKSITFDHAPHLTGLRRGKKLRCTSCHSQIVQGSHMTVTPSSCFLCHFKETSNDAPIHQCTKCHQPPVAQKADGTVVSVPYDHKMVLDRKIQCQKCHGPMIVGDGAVPKIRCSSCHADVENLKHYNDGPMMHKNHITDHKIECDQCHTEIQHKSIARTQSVKPDCNACHPDFHNAQLYLFSGKGGRGIPDHPSPMYQSGLNCQACHLFHQAADDFADKGHTVRASALSCEPCHGTGYNKMIERWKSQTEQSIARLTQILDTTTASIEKNKTHKNYHSARKKLDDASYNYKLVKYGNSIHNIAFANILMEKSYQLAKASLQELGVPVKIAPFQVQTPITPGDCSNCHVGLELKVLPVFGWQYSHAIHVKKQGLACNRCHSNEQKHGALIITKQDCMNCHHQEPKTGKPTACKTCHVTQDALYFSTLQFSTFNIPNVMANAVTCAQCHQPEKGAVVRPSQTVCVNCHDKEYGDMFSEWQTTTLTQLKRLRDKVQKEQLSKGNLSYDTLLLLEKDGSKGVHNPELIEKLLAEALR